MAAGATVCTIHVEMNRNQLDNIFTRLEPKLILYQDGLQLDDLLPETSAPCLRIGHAVEPRRIHCSPNSRAVSPRQPPTVAGAEDDAIILFTSGTSAKPKGVILNFREYLLNIDPLAEGFGITANDRLYDFRPFSWNSAQTSRRSRCRQSRRNFDLVGKILGKPFLPSYARTRCDDCHRQSDHDQHSAQQR